MCWDQRVSPLFISADEHGNSDVIGGKGLRVTGMKGIYVIKLFSSRHSLKCPFTVLISRIAGVYSWFISGHTHGIFCFGINTQVSPLPEVVNFPFHLSKSPMLSSS